MKVLVACEESQRVCTAFRARGHEAYSCDIIDCSGGHPEGTVKVGDIRFEKTFHEDRNQVYYCFGIEFGGVK